MEVNRVEEAEKRRNLSHYGKYPVCEKLVVRFRGADSAGVSSVVRTKTVQV